MSASQAEHAGSIPVARSLCALDPSNREPPHGPASDALAAPSERAAPLRALAERTFSRFVSRWHVTGEVS